MGTPTPVGTTVVTGGTVSVGVSAGAAIGAAAGEQALRTSVAAIAIARRTTGVVLDRRQWESVPHDTLLPDDRRCALDRLYAGVDHALDQLLDHLGFSLAA